MTTDNEKSEIIAERLGDTIPDHELMLTPSTDIQGEKFNPQSGKIGWAILWLLGVPLPVLIIIYLIWGR